jgi:hypothetical protein
MSHFKQSFRGKAHCECEIRQRTIKTKYKPLKGVEVFECKEFCSNHLAIIFYG